jgi:hypothetical protein
MDAEPEIALRVDLRLAGVETHSHAHGCSVGPRMRVESSLRRDRGGDSVAGSFEGDEERVALGVDLPPLVRLASLPNQALVLLEYVRVSVAEALHEGGRAFEVREEERDRAAR